MARLSTEWLEQDSLTMQSPWRILTRYPSRGDGEVRDGMVLALDCDLNLDDLRAAFVLEVPAEPASGIGLAVTM